MCLSCHISPNVCFLVSFCLFLFFVSWILCLLMYSYSCVPMCCFSLPTDASFFLVFKAAYALETIYLFVSSCMCLSPSASFLSFCHTCLFCLVILSFFFVHVFFFVSFSLKSFTNIESFISLCWSHSLSIFTEKHLFLAFSLNYVLFF